MKRYAFFDIDNTLYDGYITAGFYLFLADNKLISNPEYVYQRDKEIGKEFYGGKIDYAEATRQVIKVTADIVKGKDKKEVTTWQNRFIQEHNKFFPWVDELFTLLRQKDYILYLISAAASPPVEAVADYLEIDKSFSSELIVKDGIYTGKVKSILNYEEKKKVIHRIIGHLKYSRKIGFGDSEGDIDMLSHMDVAFLYNPRTEEVKRIAEEKAWHIVNKDNIVKLVKRYS